MALGIEADLSNVGNYVGAVGGILDAVESPAFKGNFINHLMNKLKVKFMTDTISVHQAGMASLDHVFEWPEQDGRGVSTGSGGDTPLFKLTKEGTRNARTLGFTFLPSERPVPLPDPARYGFKPEKLEYLRRHIFRYKAIVMEMDSAVHIAPTTAKKLFIPDASNKYGYYMTSNPQVINPGGKQATGGFTSWWNEWMETRAQGIVNEESALAEQHIASTGQTVIRYAAGTKVNGKSVGGQFARGSSVSFAHVEAEQRTAEIRFMGEIMQYYPEEVDW